MNGFDLSVAGGYAWDMLPHEFPVVLGRDFVGMSEVVMTSGLDWTIVRFLAPKHGPARGRLRQGFFGFNRLGFAVTRADIATFTAAQINSARYVAAAPAISN